MARKEGVAGVALFNYLLPYGTPYKLELCARATSYTLQLLPPPGGYRITAERKTYPNASAIDFPETDDILLHYKSAGTGRRNTAYVGILLPIGGHVLYNPLSIVFPLLESHWRAGGVCTEEEQRKSPEKSAALGFAECSARRHCGDASMSTR